MVCSHVKGAWCFVLWSRLSCQRQLGPWIPPI
uniref:Uncharacterized protein n=1 Tax=Arundo donax TaxID=35708 RepID=A0A0A8YYW8_ARUDO